MKKETKESVKELKKEIFEAYWLDDVLKWHLQKQIELLDKLIKELEERKIRFMGRSPLYVERQQLKEQLKAIEE